MANHQEYPLKHDGIFLGYDKNIPLKNEGLGRHLAFLISGWVKLIDRRVTIACPRWLVDDLQALLKEHGVSPEDYDLLLATESPLQSFERSFKKLESRIRPAIHRIRAWIRGESLPVQSPAHGGAVTQFMLIDLNRLIDFKNWRWSLVEVGKLVAYLVVGVGLIRWLWPVLLALAVLLILYRIWRRYRKARRAGLDVDLRKHAVRHKRSQRRYAKEMAGLIKRINQQQVVGHWLVPTPFWPECCKIEHSKVVVCPDLVLQEFPLRFADPSAEPIYERILNTLQESQRLVCYSSYVQQQQLVRGVGLAKDQIQVIGHGRVELRGSLALGSSSTTSEFEKEVALENLRVYQKTHLSGNPFWSRFAWDRQDYVFYSSQARGQKNILSLVRAIEILRQRRENSVRLVLTCGRVQGSELDLFVSEHRLDAWVLFASGVSNQVLASFYSRAALAVNPTLFEGGFPFTFTEAYSVGTPSLLSDIPMVREKVEQEELIDRMLFDPLDPEDLANKIRWGIQNREELLRLQHELYESFPEWQSVAQQYSDALRFDG